MTTEATEKTVRRSLAQGRRLRPALPAEISIEIARLSTGGGAPFKEAFLVALVERDVATYVAQNWLGQVGHRAHQHMGELELVAEAVRAIPAPAAGAAEEGVPASMPEAVRANPDYRRAWLLGYDGQPNPYGTTDPLRRYYDAGAETYPLDYPEEAQDAPAPAAEA